MAKIVIPKEKLPNVPDNNNLVYIRFKIVSEDRNRSSAWTPIFVISKPEVYIQLTDTDSSFIFSMI